LLGRVRGAGRADRCVLGCCSGGYQRPSDACHQPGPWGRSCPTVSPPARALSAERYPERMPFPPVIPQRARPRLLTSGGEIAHTARCPTESTDVTPFPMNLGVSALIECSRSATRDRFMCIYPSPRCGAYDFCRDDTCSQASMGIEDLKGKGSPPSDGPPSASGAQRARADLA
jgi:hypothetical protein